MRASAAPPAAIISAAIGVIAKAMGIPQEQFLKFIEKYYPPATFKPLLQKWQTLRYSWLPKRAERRARLQT